MEKQSKRLTRTLIFVFVFVSAYVLPWWISAPIILGLIIYFPLYLEALFFGFLFDILYSTQHWGLVIASSILALSYLVKSRIRT